MLKTWPGMKRRRESMMSHEGWKYFALVLVLLNDWELVAWREAGGGGNNLIRRMRAKGERPNRLESSTDHLCPNEATLPLSWWCALNVIVILDPGLLGAFQRFNLITDDEWSPTTTKLQFTCFIWKSTSSSTYEVMKSDNGIKTKNLSS